MLEDFRLKVFAEVARCGSFTEAAVKLGVTQPAVSQNIAELEKRTGEPLFVRKRGSVTLTAQGELFSLMAGRIISGYDALNAVFEDYPSYMKLKEELDRLRSDPRFTLIDG